MNTARIKTPGNWIAMTRGERLRYLAGTLAQMARLVEVDAIETDMKPDRNANGNTIAIKIKVKS